MPKCSITPAPKKSSCEYPTSLESTSIERGAFKYKIAISPTTTTNRRNAAMTALLHTRFSRFPTSEHDHCARFIQLAFLNVTLAAASYKDIPSTPENSRLEKMYSIRNIVPNARIA